MLEKRQAKRRRVCLHGSVTSGLTHAVIPVHVRDVSATGAQIRVVDGALPGRDVAFRVDRTGEVQEAEVVWRSMELYGLRFRTAKARQPEAVAADRLPATVAPDSPLTHWLERQPTP